jgi:hypothetical protein
MQVRALRLARGGAQLIVVASNRSPGLVSRVPAISPVDLQGFSSLGVPCCCCCCCTEPISGTRNTHGTTHGTTEEKRDNKADTEEKKTARHKYGHRAVRTG